MQECQAVAQATASGSHEEELNRWREVSGADLVESEREEIHTPALNSVRRALIADHARHGLYGKSVEELREARDLAESLDLVANAVVVSQEDQDAAETAEVVAVTTAQVLSVLHEIGAEVYLGQICEPTAAQGAPAVRTEDPVQDGRLHANGVSWDPSETSVLGIARGAFELYGPIPGCRVAPDGTAWRPSRGGEVPLAPLPGLDEENIAALRSSISFNIRALRTVTGCDPEMRITLPGYADTEQIDRRWAEVQEASRRFWTEAAQAAVS